MVIHAGPDDPLNSFDFTMSYWVYCHPTLVVLNVMQIKNEGCDLINPKGCYIVSSEGDNVDIFDHLIRIDPEKL